MSLISGKHKMVILYCLMEYEPVRFNEMKRYLGRITDKMLSTNLKELEADRLISRKEYQQIPSKVEYFPDRARKIAHGGARQALRLGQREQDMKHDILPIGIIHAKKQLIDG